MTYDPFTRGPFPVGARSGLLSDGTRDGRELPFEVWYPAADEAAGLDLDASTHDAFTAVPDGPTLRQAAVRDAAPRTGRHPLLIFSHSSGGHRRGSSFLCTHLASHGYVVAACDHIGNAAAEYLDRVRRTAAGEPPRSEAEVDVYVQQIIADRVPDLRLLLDQLLAGAAGDVADRIDDQRIGLIGWSFGGWAALATLEQDDRFSAVVALAPAGNSKPLPGIIPAKLTFAWKREVPTLILAAEKDRFTPLPGIYELFDRTPSRKQMFILREADHGHFADQIDEPGLCPPEAAHLFTSALALAHMDAALKADAAASKFLTNDPTATLKALGVDALAHPPDV